jgi:hypothetical protein
MGGERRRRRLRRARHWPGDAPAEPIANGDPEPEQADAELPGAGAPDGPPDQPATEPVEAVPDQPAAAAAPPTPATVHPDRRIPGEPSGDQRRRRGRGPGGPGPGVQHRPSPADLAELAGSFALTAGVHDPEPAADAHGQQHGDDPSSERGLRGLVGGGSSQVNVTAAMRARDASRPSDEHLAAAEADLPIVRRGWVPRDELPRPGGGH